MTLDTRLDAAIHWAHPRLEFHISVWFQGCEQWADLLSQVLWSRHKEGRRAKTTLLQDKDTSGGGGMVSLWLCLCVCVSLSVCLCVCVSFLCLCFFFYVSPSLCLCHLCARRKMDCMNVNDHWPAKGGDYYSKEGQTIIIIIIIYHYYLLLLFIIIISRTGNRPSQLRRQILVEKTTSQKRNCDISIFNQWKKMYIWIQGLMI